MTPVTTTASTEPELTPHASTEPTASPVPLPIDLETDHQLFRAFNPDRQIRNRTPLEKLNSKLPTGTNYSDELTTAERIAESAFIRRQLINNTNPTQFKTLQLFYQQFPTTDQNIQLAMDLFAPLVSLTTTTASLLVNNCNQQFAALVILSHAWNTNLFKRNHWGPVDRYYYPMAASRKRRRLITALENFRLDALKQAHKILNP